MRAAHVKRQVKLKAETAVVAMETDRKVKKLLAFKADIDEVTDKEKFTALTRDAILAQERADRAAERKEILRGGGNPEAIFLARERELATQKQQREFEAQQGANRVAIAQKLAREQQRDDRVLTGTMATKLAGSVTKRDRIGGGVTKHPRMAGDAAVTVSEEVTRGARARGDSARGDSDDNNVPDDLSMFAPLPVPF